MFNTICESRPSFDAILMFAVSLDQITSVAGPPVDIHVIVWVVLLYFNDTIVTRPAYMYDCI